MPRLVLISDTHNMLNQVVLPEGDILAHTGDATMQGTPDEIKLFNEHLGLVKDKFKHIVFAPGNHDFSMQDTPTRTRALITNATTLIDEEVLVLGYKFYGSPWQPWFHDWAFNFPERDHDQSIAAAKWAEIPADTNVLLTHGPPYMMMDKVARPRANQDPHVGCKAMAKRIEELTQLKVHSFGHIHERYGEVKTSKVHFVNASICTLQYKPTNAPIVIDLPDIA